MVLSLGIGGGLAGRATFGDVVVAGAARAADLGAESPAGFVPLSELGFGRDAFDVDPALRAALEAALPGAVVGEVLTVSTVTGTAGRAEALAARHPGAVVEAMEGYGVAVAAYALGVPFGEVRTISNPVGPRDRAAWRIGPALAALTAVGQALGTLDR
jgi:futalosine hydrolase